MPTRRTYTTFKAYIDSYINTNGTQAITGLIMNTALTDLAYSILFADVRKAKATAITAGANTITFSSAIAADTYTLVLRAYDADGNPIDVAVDSDSYTVNGFTLTAATAGRLDYAAIC
jgi:hypothetical protein